MKCKVTACIYHEDCTFLDILQNILGKEGRKCSYYQNKEIEKEEISLPKKFQKKKKGKK